MIRRSGVTRSLTLQPCGGAAGVRSVTKRGVAKTLYSSQNPLSQTQHRSKILTEAGRLFQRRQRTEKFLSFFPIYIAFIAAPVMYFFPGALARYLPLWLVGIIVPSHMLRANLRKYEVQLGNPVFERLQIKFEDQGVPEAIQSLCIAFSKANARQGVPENLQRRVEEIVEKSIESGFDDESQIGLVIRALRSPLDAATLPPLSDPPIFQLATLANIRTLGLGLAHENFVQKFYKPFVIFAGGVQLLLTLQNPIFLPILITSLPMFILPFLMFRTFSLRYSINPLVEKLQKHWGECPKVVRQMVRLYLKTLKRQRYVVPALRENIYRSLDVAATYRSAPSTEIKPLIDQLRATLRQGR